MLDVEVIDNRRYGVLEADSKAAKLVKAVYGRLMMMRLAAAEGEKPFLTQSQVREVARNAGFQCSDHDISVLVTYGLLEHEMKSEWVTYGNWANGRSVLHHQYYASDLGLEVMKDFRDGEVEVLIPLAA